MPDETSYTAAQQAQNDTYRRQAAIDLAIRSLAKKANDIDQLVEAAKKIDAFLKADAPAA